MSSLTEYIALCQELCTRKRTLCPFCRLKNYIRAKRFHLPNQRSALVSFPCLSQSKALHLWIRRPPILQKEKAMAIHSSILAWQIPWMEEPGRLQSTGSQRVGHDWATSLWLFPFMRWRRKWQPTPVFLPGESQGRGSLVGCHLWGRTESDTTEAT